MGFEGRLKFIADPELDPADCRIGWDDGGAARNATALTAKIDKIVEEFLEQRFEPTQRDDPSTPAQDAPAAIEAESDSVMPAEQNVAAANTETVAAEPALEPNKSTQTPPPDIEAAVVPAMEPNVSAEAPPPVIDGAAEENETTEILDPPAIVTPAVESPPPGDTADAPAVDVAAPEKPQTPPPAAGPVLPGAVDIDPAAT